MRPSKADLLKKEDSTKSVTSKAQSKKIELPFKTFTECLRYLFVKYPEKMEDI